MHLPENWPAGLRSASIRVRSSALLLCNVRTASSKRSTLAASNSGSQCNIALQTMVETQLTTNGFTGAQLPMIKLKQKCLMQFEPKKKEDRNSQACDLLHDSFNLRLRIHASRHLKLMVSYLTCAWVT